ncbi:thioesterase II family protein [Haliangium ochraceum]|uniref:Oleoyl-(Acyl-carrier-protein) hydrolase n=1 Tax=Haliangium ochraceum (strain DSM 14365 / JCM 11303 / SMP-2) TaxID=502025 RepID=D0LMB0_HALO1|nr:alpha/beta fold hydrolase [Haliangium ochraceum]ACY16816.1 Oleoyl-(acyl-carrier-protein) hydrolase [Haliangium ochraceum DSM 14365]
MPSPTLSSPAPRPPWFPYLQPLPAPRHRLFCFHHAGGSASSFRTWGAALKSRGVEVWAVQLPGRENRWREPRIERMDVAVRACVDALKPHLDQPFSLLGHSMGARLAFAVTRELESRALPPPAHVMVTGSRPPQAPSRAQSDLSDAGLLATLRRLGGTPKAVLEHPELLEMVLPLLRADLRILASFEAHPDAPISVPLHAFGGEGDEEVPRELLADWGAYSSQASEPVLLPGGHFFVYDAANDMPGRVAEILV